MTFQLDPVSSETRPYIFKGETHLWDLSVSKAFNCDCGYYENDHGVGQESSKIENKLMTLILSKQKNAKIRGGKKNKKSSTKQQ